MIPAANRSASLQRLAASAVVAVLVASLWLPWHTSGSRARSAFELLETAEELKLGPTALRDVWHWLLPVVPLVAVLALSALWLGRTLAWTVLALGLVTVVGVGAAAVVAAPTQSAVGVYVAAVACVSLLGLLALMTSK